MGEEVDGGFSPAVENDQNMEKEGNAGSSPAAVEKDQNIVEDRDRKSLPSLEKDQKVGEDGDGESSPVVERYENVGEEEDGKSSQEVGKDQNIGKEEDGGFLPVAENDGNTGEEEEDEESSPVVEKDQNIGVEEAEKDGGFSQGPLPFGEVQTAMDYLQSLVKGEARSGKESIIVSPDSNIVLKSGRARFNNALDLLQKEPAVENLVVNISSDKGFWNAIMKNEAVQNLRSSISKERDTQLEMKESTEGPDMKTRVLGWIQEMITRSKIRELIEKIGAMLADLFVAKHKDKPISDLNDLQEERIRSSFLLSVVIIFIIVLTRNN
ncbi:OLC1v1012168C1 [Oldenlandia corymbosa var. corymbosa]|uniref:OLC1v1012168C1 n=1 Tax=Oldenlandia corymbosa var. corymbosa TaxID=529605 RepID=A0AAV1DVI8_OLDCO|nr:OLC1v1012168C1 [Oldenlandia corymbosa var. corymbosa]